MTQYYTALLGGPLSYFKVLSVYSESLITQHHSELLRVVVLFSKGFTDYSEWL